MESKSPVDFDELKLHEVISKGPLDFHEWTSLISEIDKMYPDDLKKICLVYDSFLSEFPLCYGYWRKYADHKTRLCTVDKVVEIFERAVQSATYSVGVWVDYCTFSMSVFEDSSDIRRLFQRGISFVGKDYMCHTLWDKYIEFELSQQQWSSLTHIYIKALRFPTKKLRHYYNCFKKLVAFWEEEIKCQSISATEKLQKEPVLESKKPICFKDDEISCIIKDLLDPSAGFARSKALQKYLSVGEWFYKEAHQLDDQIRHFEANIHRSYFHVKPLDSSQLENWHNYLDSVEMHGDFDWAVKLYERCLIPCANYPEFWMRYVEFMESKGGREIANNALDRLTLIFLKRVPVVHLFKSRFKEQIGDVCGAQAAFLQCEAESGPNFVENVKMKANMEKRMGNLEAASNVYKEALEMAAMKKMTQTLSILYVHFSRLKYMSSGSADAAINVLVDGIKHVPHCKLLLEELVNFTMMHEGPRHINVVDCVIANAISPGPGISQGLNGKDAEDISNLYIEFVDLCGTIHDLRKAWNRHIRLFPHSLRTLSKPHQQYGDLSSNLLIQLSLRDKKISPLEKYDTQSDQAPTNISEQKLPSFENNDNQIKQVSVDQIQSRDDGNSVQASPKVSEQPQDNTLELGVPSVDNTLEPGVASVDSTLEPGVPSVDKTPEPSVPSEDLVQEHVSPEVPEQLRRDTPDPNVSSLNLIQGKQVAPEGSKQPREDTSEPIVSSVDRLVHITNGAESLQCSKECLKEPDVLQQYDQESEQDLKPPLLENLSLNTQNDRSPKSVPSTSHTGESSEDTQMLNRSMLQSSCSASPNASLCSPLGTQASSRTKIEVVNPSASASHQNPIPTQTIRQPQFTANSGGNWRQRNNPDRVRRNFKFGSRGHSQRKIHQHRQEPPQKYPRAEMDAQMPTSQCYSSQSSQNAQVQQSSQVQNQFQEAAAHTNLTTNNAWQVQNVQQQSIATASESQLPAIPIASQTSQYVIQSDGQYGPVQNNHMWQYYYYQQQQFLLQQQQQQLQLQQQQQHPQQQQYQQQLQQHYHQLQQNPFQQQQLQQLQQQQLQYNQQQQLSLQQPYQQQQQQLLYPQQPLQHQEQQPLQQEEVEQREHQQQNTPSDIQT
ncbi:hypothetical protein ACB094_05G117900 [Castanea mollissima]